MMILDSAVGGAFMNKLVEESIIILEVVASNYSQWKSKKENYSRRVALCKYEVSDVYKLTEKFDALSKKFIKKIQC